MRTSFTYQPTDLNLFKAKLLAWSQTFTEVLWLDSNAESNPESGAYSSFEAVLAVGAFTSIKTNWAQAFSQLQDYQKACSDWIFGYLSYDLKNDTEALSSHNFDALEFPDLYFFQPKKLFFIKDNQVSVQYLNAFSAEWETDLNAIQAISLQEINTKQASGLSIKARIPKAAYLTKVNQVLNHIYRGDIYEANFCQEFYANNATINPLQTYNKLNSISKPPFAAFLKMADKYALCASPERYLKKYGNTVVSQPIKGTAKRSKDKETDLALKQTLATDAKERSENIMIVDLVRNDLSKTAVKGSVTVSELCKVYAFKQVHQMISTITSRVPKNTCPSNVIKTTFPMGSMTGAPKISAMRIIEATEETKRGLYSGAIGYISPQGDFDFNVVIRSILYNHSKKYVSFSVGSAITAKSTAEKEYNECLLKAKAMRQVLEQPNNADT
ncbi:anthranilate synthase component I family protein [Bizionia sediminis]|uniref:Anthranilate synthase component I family protein n=1 Tax=Bizionia sediminis TaxID=1737064 RepID=A0ABW5KSM0_9FLAO